MECSFYQFKRKNECTECVNEEDIDPEETVNRLVGDFSQENGGNATNNAFRPWCYGFSSGLTLIFKYAPPKKTDIMERLSSKACCIPLDAEDSRNSLKEFSPEFSKEISSLTYKYKKLNPSDNSSLSTHDSSSSVEMSKKQSSLKDVASIKKHKQITKSYNNSLSTHDSSSSVEELVKCATLKHATIEQHNKLDDSDNRLSTHDSSSSLELLLKQPSPKGLTSIKKHRKLPVNESSHNFLSIQHTPDSTDNTSTSKDSNSTDTKLTMYVQTTGNNHSVTHKSSNSKETPKNCSSEKISTAGAWCASVSKSYQKTSPLKRQISKEIEEIKKKYCISSYHRGKWVLVSDSCRTLKISGVWREICKMLKCGRLPYCNAKYEKTNQEIWIYCDVLSSLDVRKKLKSNYNLHMTSPLSYWIHPHGIVLKH